MKRAIAIILGLFMNATALAENIKVAAAVSLKEAIQKVAEQYKVETGNTVEFTFGSSGQLATQIIGGAPTDLFISAANKQVDDIVKADAGVADSRKVVAGNKLVLIVPSDDNNAPNSLKALASDGVGKVSIGETKTVPAGQYAIQALEKSGVLSAIKHKLVFGTNVRQVLDYVERGEVSAGLVYATDAKQSGEKVKVAATIDPTLHEPIVYPAIIVKGSKNQAGTGKFLEYLASAKGQTILMSFGFTSPAQ